MDEGAGDTGPPDAATDQRRLRGEEERGIWILGRGKGVGYQGEGRGWTKVLITLGLWIQPHTNSP